MRGREEQEKGGVGVVGRFGQSSRSSSSTPRLDLPDMHVAERGGTRDVNASYCASGLYINLNCMKIERNTADELRTYLIVTHDSHWQLKRVRGNSMYGVTDNGNARQSSRRRGSPCVPSMRRQA